MYAAIWGRFPKSAVFGRANFYNKYKTADSRKIAAKRDFCKHSRLEWRLFLYKNGKIVEK